MLERVGFAALNLFQIGLVVFMGGVQPHKVDGKSAIVLQQVHYRAYVADKAVGSVVAMPESCQCSGGL